MLDYKNTIADIKGYKENLYAQLHTNLDKASAKILEEARDNAPIDIGTMREDSGHYTKEEDNNLISYIGFMKFYAVYVHQGTGLFALHGDGRQTPWWWKGTTEKWKGWHYTHGQTPKQFLWDSLTGHIEILPILLAEGLE